MFCYSLERGNFVPNGFGIGAVSSIGNLKEHGEKHKNIIAGNYCGNGNINMDRDIVLLNNRSSATASKVSDMAHCTQCYVTRQLSERCESENGNGRNFIAESVTRN